LPHRRGVGEHGRGQREPLAFEAQPEWPKSG
jgi:hypothetical protein